VDFVPFVGIIGAVVGACIGLLGQGSNRKEQRRKDLLERIASLLKACDDVHLSARRLKRLVRLQNKEKAREVAGDLTAAIGEVGHQAQYLQLTAPYKIRVKVEELANASTDVSRAADVWVHDNSGGPSEDFKIAGQRYLEHREALLEHVRPDIHRKPWWVRKSANKG